MVTASTGKAATNIDGTTLHSAFQLPVREGLCNCGKLSNEKLHILQIKYQYLQILLIDEISMIGKETFNDLNKYLRQIKNTDLEFGGVSILLIGDFSQLPPVNQKTIFSSVTPTDSWLSFCLHELHEIVRQSSDPHFAQLLNRLREGNQTHADVEDIKELANTDTSDWPPDYTKLYVTKALVNNEKEKCMTKLLEDGKTIVVVHAKDSKADLHTGSQMVNIDENTPISKTGNLPRHLKVCVGARVMLTNNMDISDRLINGLMGTVMVIDRLRNNKTASGIIYIKFDDIKAGNKLKDRRLRGELKECVPIQPVAKRFSYKKNRGTIVVERKQFPLILAHAITIHKSQGSTVEYLSGDLDQTSRNAKRSVPISKGMLYTLLSRAKSRDKLQLLNFEERHIRVNKHAVREMRRMRNECVLSWNHPLTQLSGGKICLFNIVSWNLHIEHFLTDEVYSTYSSVFCFTETRVNSGHYKDIEDYQQGWENIHKPTEHGLAICYDTSKVKIVRQFTTTGALQLLPVLMKIENELLLLVLVYRPPRPIGTFVYELIQEISTLPLDEYREYRPLIVGDFKLGQMLEENVRMFEQLLTHFNCQQRSHYSTHIRGGILDLVFDDRRSESVQWMPSPISDHFVILIDV